MPYYDMKTHTFIAFQKSTSPGKKYDALIKNNSSGKVIKVSFGDKNYEHYRDSTGIGLYSKLDHLDSKRRKNYNARHSHWIKPSFYSPGYFAKKYLW